MTIKPTWIVTDMDLNPLYDGKLEMNREFATEKAAIRAAKDEVRISEGDEMWVWRLSHVVSKPDAEPDVKAVE